ncbi:hypothetical protein C7G42_02650 [Bradyrhizobium sp. MOS003]|nr:hypothetical protein C7G42_02650 [Bradyrhizobium sp. MOS003]
MDTGTRQENASKQESRAPFRCDWNGKGSRLLGRKMRPKRTQNQRFSCQHVASELACALAT